MKDAYSTYPVVIVHNYLESFREFLGRSGEEHTLFDRRFNGDQALFWLGDSKLVVSSAPIENAEELKERWGYPNARTLAPEKYSASLSEDILADDGLLAAVLAYAGEGRKLALIPYATTPEFLALADRLRRKHGLEVVTPESLSPENLWIKPYVDSKVGFRSLAAQWLGDGCRIPLGFTSSKIELVEDMVVWLRRAGKGAVVKASMGGSGVGNLFLPLEATPSREALAARLRENEFLKEDLFVVEELIPSPERISPSLEFGVPPKGVGEVVMTYPCLQHFEESGRFAGVIVGDALESAPWYPSFFQVGMEVARQLQEMGYVGTFDLDAIVDAEGQVYLLEINTRRTGGTYAHEFLTHVFGPDYPGRFTALGENKLYVGAACSLAELEAALGDLAYPMADRERGVIPLLTSMLFKGYLGYLLLGESLEDVRNLREEMIARLGG